MTRRTRPKSVSGCITAHALLLPQHTSILHCMAHSQATSHQAGVPSKYLVLNSCILACQSCAPQHAWEWERDSTERSSLRLCIVVRGTPCQTHITLLACRHLEHILEPNAPPKSQLGTSIIPWRSTPLHPCLEHTLVRTPLLPCRRCCSREGSQGLRGPRLVPVTRTEASFKAPSV